MSKSVASGAIRWAVIHASFQATFLFCLDQPKHQLRLSTAHGVCVLLIVPEVLDFQKFYFCQNMGLPLCGSKAVAYLLPFLGQTTETAVW